MEATKTPMLNMDNVIAIDEIKNLTKADQEAILQSLESGNIRIQAINNMFADARKPCHEQLIKQLSFDDVCAVCKTPLKNGEFQCRCCYECDGQDGKHNAGCLKCI